MAYSFHHPRTEVRSQGAKGSGLVATGPIAAGEVVVVTGGKILSFASQATHDLPGHPFQVERHQIIAPFDDQVLDGIFMVNHSCDPTTGVRGQTSLVALRAIAAGEEITFDYAMTDSDPDGRETFSMDCLCGTRACRRRITDLDWRQAELRRRYRGYFSSYIEKRIADEDGST